MTKYIRRSFAVGLPVAMLAAGACSGDKKNDSLAQDSSLSRDMQLANRDSVVQPQLNDVPAAGAATKTTTSTATRVPAPTPVRSEPRPRRERRPEPAAAPPPTVSTTQSGNTMTRTPGAAERPLGTIGAGSALALTSNSRVCTNTNHVGDRVTASVANTVTGSNGAVIPAGASATLEITELKRSENMNDKIEMGFRLISVSFGGHSYPATGTINSVQVDRVRNEGGNKDAQKVGTGAAVGAIVGQIFGHSTKSTIIGGAVGAAAGAGAAVTTANYEGCVPQGGNISVSLNNAVQVHT